ncbi:MAG TPA: cryptochrome/photolyase family protein [Saprospiraceae bacterium]|nr:cryptochrome/photolyase family protein [Saprospiraceae bacterium]
MADQTLRLILGDQLNLQHSWFENTDKTVTYLMAESRSETDYVRHHIQKVVGFFLSMRAFAQKIEEKGHQVIYLELNDHENQSSIIDNVKHQLTKGDFEKFEYLLPDEYRLDQALEELKGNLSIPVESYDTEHFLSKRETVAELFEGKKQWLMETFYRQMRKDYDIMMEEDGKTPITGQWNYDEDNRKKLPKEVDIPSPLSFQRDVQEIVDLLESEGVKTIGQLDAAHFDWPLTREENLELLDHFLQHQFINFGRYQDAMTDRGYLLFHSKLSFGMNTKQISPSEVVEAALQYWKDHQDDIDIAQVEGFVRQIIGWREFMRGIYWAKMPEFAEMNFFGHDCALPSWFWTGETKMKCLSHAIGQSLDKAYAHHIQRLMVTGNFALLLGVHPDELDEWYLGIYMDAIQWVEITNTRGMSQFADGGIVGTKPYVSSANYINKMGDYCKNCQYAKSKKTGENACPFNSLYWDFYDRHRDKLADNHRVAMMFRVWDRMGEDKQADILEQAAFYKENIEEL